VVSSLNPGQNPAVCCTLLFFKLFKNDQHLKLQKTKIAFLNHFKAFLYAIHFGLVLGDAKYRPVKVGNYEHGEYTSADEKRHTRILHPAHYCAG